MRFFSFTVDTHTSLEDFFRLGCRRDFFTCIAKLRDFLVFLFACFLMCNFFCIRNIDESVMKNCNNFDILANISFFCFFHGDSRIFFSFSDPDHRPYAIKSNRNRISLVSI